MGKIVKFIKAHHAFAYHVGEVGEISNENLAKHKLEDNDFVKEASNDEIAEYKKTVQSEKAVKTPKVENAAIQ